MSDTLIAVGIVCVAAGILIKTGFHIPVLPGDILIKKEGFTFYFPVVTSIVVSIILTFIFSRIRK